MPPPKVDHLLTAAQQEALKKWSQLVAKVQADEKLKQRLLASPAAVLQEHGITVPEGKEIRVVENTDKVSYLMLPPKLSVSELTPGQLQGVVGGVIIEYTVMVEAIIELCIRPFMK
jgi:hypothetical protein